MPQFKTTVAVPAGGAVQNAIAGSAFEFLSRPSRVQVWVTCIAAGAGLISSQIQFGPEIQLESALVPIERTAGWGPTADELPLADDIGAAGDRLVVRLTNTGAGPHNAQVLVRIVPLA